MATERPVHLRSLTSLRFLAAGVVLLHHLPLAMPGLLGLLYLAQAGYVGVTFFFVLSGFVLAYSQASLSRVDFYVRRGARIYPVHLLTALVMVLLLLRNEVAWGALPFNLALVQAWSPDANVHLSFVGASWSLSCEAFFYACFPWLFPLLERARRPLGWAIGLVLGALGAGLIATNVWPQAGEYLYHLPVFRLADFAVGILMALAIRRGWRVSFRPAAAGALVASTYLMVLVVQTKAVTGADVMWLFSLVMILPFALLIGSVAGHELDGWQSVLASRPSVALGQWSFAIYLVHGVLLRALDEHVHDLHGAPAVVVGIAVVALIITTSWLVYALYERPMDLMVRRRLTAGAHRRRGVEAGPAAQGVGLGALSDPATPA